VSACLPAIDRGNREVQSHARGNRDFVVVRGANMFGLSDLFQWDRFVTPTVIKVFYWLAVVICLLLGAAGAVSSLQIMAFNPFIGLIFLIVSLLGAFVGIILSRIAAEFVLIVFRINEHLGAIKNQGAAMKGQESGYRGQ
jgi:hypothetical protein